MKRLLIFAAFLITGCSAFPVSLDRVRLVTCQKGPAGSAFGVKHYKGDTIFATCAHVVAYAQAQMRLKGFDARLMYFNPDTDVALIAIPGFHRVETLGTPSYGDKVQAFGYPYCKFPYRPPAENQAVSSRGFVSWIDDTRVGIDGGMAPGYSGGPVFNERGEVIGMGHAGLSPGGVFNIAVHAKCIREAVEQVAP